MPVQREKFIARVTDNVDPQKRGRIKVTCSGLMGDDEVELPGFIEPNFDWGTFQVPDIGELIEIECNATNDQAEGAAYQAFLENPDICWNGVRIDSLKAGTKRPVDEMFTKKNYGKRRGFATPAGHVLMFDDTSGEQQVTLTWRQGEDFSQLTFNEDGSIMLLDKASNMIFMNAKPNVEGVVILDANANMIATRPAGVLINDQFNNFIELKDGVVSVSAAGDMQVQASKGINLQSGAGEAQVTLNADGVIEINADDADVEVTCAAAKIDADTYSLGKGADSPGTGGTPLVRHDAWEFWAAAHTHPTAFGPSGPPSIPPTPDIPSLIGTMKCSFWAVLAALAMFFWFLR